MFISRSVRLSQTLTPFGVGAIYDLLGESFVACDTSMWKASGNHIVLERLSEDLEVNGFRSAPTDIDLFRAWTSRVPYARFPQWLFCSRCRRMKFWQRREEQPGEAPRCSFDKCGAAQLVPMRFIVVCENGHMDEVPWHLWAHLGSQHSEPQSEVERCGSRDLSFEFRAGLGAGLASLRIRCNACGSSRALTGISQKDSLKQFPFAIRCSGKQPWQHSDWAGPCELTPQIVQRGSSNVCFAVIESALDIPPESHYGSDAALRRKLINSEEFRIVVKNPHSRFTKGSLRSIAGKLETNEERILDLAIRSLEGSVRKERTKVDRGHDLATGEWLAFQEDRGNQDDRDHFVTRVVKLIADEEHVNADSHRMISALLSRVVVATRLREVRALRGFSRLRPDNQRSPLGKMLSPSLGREDIDWLPAVEVFGEGIFMALDESAVREWERGAEVVAAARQLESRRERSLFGTRLGITVTPRFVLLHTFAHVLIHQLAFDCGYAAPSLCERIYASPPERGRTPQAGILVYTAAGDSEGTLGGLVRRGEPPRLRDTLIRALANAAWCSADPLCLESDGQGLDSLNVGACHACTLASETSCAHFNMLLDRRFLIGSDEVPGFFQPVLESALEEAASRGRHEP